MRIRVFGACNGPKPSQKGTFEFRSLLNPVVVDLVGDNLVRGLSGPASFQWEQEIQLRNGLLVEEVSGMSRDDRIECSFLFKDIQHVLE